LLKSSGSILAADKVNCFVSRQSLAVWRKFMKKHSPAFYHRVLLVSTLLAGATLLVFNAWVISSNDADLVFAPWWTQ